MRIDLTGRRFTRLKVLSISHFKGEGKKRAVFWLCLCNCGTKTVVRMNGLTSGHAKSCGCLKREKAAQQGKASRTHGYSRTPEYHAYIHARQRCSDPENWQYMDYGGRGIKFLFGSFEEFIKELGPRPKGKTLDRKDNDGNYEEGNIRWATRSQQNKNRRKFRARIL